MQLRFEFTSVVVSGLGPGPANRVASSLSEREGPMLPSPPIYPERPPPPAPRIAAPPPAPQQPSQPRPISQRQARPVLVSKPMPQPTATIASIEAKIGAQNKALCKIGESRRVREGERKALKPMRQIMGEPKYQNEHGRLTNLLDRLESQRCSESAKKDKLVAQLQQAKARTEKPVS